MGITQYSLERDRKKPCGKLLREETCSGSFQQGDIQAPCKTSLVATKEGEFYGIKRDIILDDVMQIDSVASFRRWNLGMSVFYLKTRSLTILNKIRLKFSDRMNSPRC